jgi:hypothetical protein
MNSRTLMIGGLWAASLAGAYYAGVSLRGEPRVSVVAGVRPAAVETIGGRPVGKRVMTAEQALTDERRRASEDGAPDDEGDVDGLTTEECRKRFERIASLPPSRERNLEYYKLISQWARIDGEGALAAAATIDEPKLRYELRESALRNWARGNPEEAYAFAMANPNKDLPEHRMQLVFDGLGRSDPDKALAFFDAHRGELEKQGDRASMVFDELYERGGHDQLVSWAERQPLGKMRDMALNRIIDRWARYDPAGAKDWMERSVTNKENIGPARVELAESWARVNPQEALQWVGSLPAKEREGDYYDRIFGRWIQYDRNAAAQQLASQPPGPHLDRPIERYTNEVMRQNPADTMPWAQSINDEGRRWRAVERVADAWRSKDKAGLQQYVLSGGFTEEQQRKLLRIEEKKK